MIQKKLTPSPTNLLAILKKNNSSLNLADIAAKFKLDSKLDANIDLLKKAIAELTATKKIYATLDKQYIYTPASKIITGKIQRCKQGHGFLLLDLGDDIYIEHSQMRHLIDGDTVQAVIKSHQGKNQGKKRHCAIIICLVHRVHNRIAGSYLKCDRGAKVIPHDRKIQLIKLEKTSDLADGTNILVALQQDENGLHAAISSVLGAQLDDKNALKSLLHCRDIPSQWSKKIIAESISIAKNAAQQSISKQSISKQSISKQSISKNRIDLRHLQFVTIDGSDAKDLDDAVCVTKDTAGWKLYVAIADVSHYVDIDNHIDIEAYKRGTSIYLPKQVIPMLPEVLSNELCSLQPQQEKLVLVCEMDIDPFGAVAKYSFYSALFSSTTRFTYNDVSLILNDNSLNDSLDNGIASTKEKLRQQHRASLSMLEEMKKLHRVLIAKRQKRGAINFNFPEVKVYFDEAGCVNKIQPMQVTLAHSIIEEYMLCANCAAADLLAKHKIPSLYRHHLPPNTEKLINIKKYLRSLSLDLTAQDLPSPQDYNQLLKQSESRDDYQAIQMMLLRSLSRAYYNPSPDTGHFGLSYSHYTHFTSPIRRYPDLLVHRAIKQLETQNLSTSSSRAQKTTFNNYPYATTKLDEMGAHCSAMESRADDISRNMSQFYKCEFMQHKIGQTFSGTISSILPFGMFITLDQLYVDGLLPIAALGTEYYTFDEQKLNLTGNDSGITYNIGDKIKVQVTRVDLHDKKIDFSLI